MFSSVFVRAGYTVLPLEDCLETCDVFVTTTGNKDIIMATHMSKMKNNAIVGNIGHFDNEIDMAGLMEWQGIKRQNIKPQCDRFIFPDGHGVIVLAEGRLLNLGCATGHPSFVMSCSFTNQVYMQPWQTSLRALVICHWYSSGLAAYMTTSVANCWDIVPAWEL